MTSLAAIAAVMVATATFEDAVGAQEVVQPLPPAGVSDLNEALRLLARNSNNVDALIDAGNASLKVNDVDAAIGFFGRAEELSPGNARIKLGLASAYIRKSRPLDALRLFDEAEAAGISTRALAGDRGLAYDLVGDNASARQQYLSALASGDDALIRQRLAINHAISGDRPGFEAAIAPLMGQDSLLAFRIRAFGLAILGQGAEAVGIAEQAMPRGQASRIAPYLRYMPRLTPAQQAAAANLGVFPQASQIGRDAPRVAGYAGLANPASVLVTRDTQLAPQGAPLGPSQPPAAAPPVRADAGTERVSTRSQRRSERRTRRNTTETTSRNALSRTRAARRERLAQAELAAAAVPVSPRTTNEISPPEPSPALAAVPQINTRQAGELPPVGTVATATPSAEPGFELARTEALLPAPIVTPAPVPVPAPATSLANAAPTAPDIDLTTESGEAPTPRPQTANISAPTVQQVPQSLNAAFADFAARTPSVSAAMQRGVDISAIEPPREKPPQPEQTKTAQAEVAKLAPPANPRRFWAQIATGRDRDALAFDWRRMRSKAGDILAGKNGYVAKWGGTNRLLAGPFENSRAANAAVAELKGAGLDSFAFTSADGEQVDPVG